MTQPQQSNTYDITHSVAAFPLGGIGTGTISLGVRGQLRDWEIFNAPAKRNNLPNTFFAIRVQQPGAEPMVRVLEGALQPPFDLSNGFHPQLNAGLPRFQNSSMRGEYPYAWVNFDDPDMPVRVELEAFTPLVPLNPEDSGIPCAVLTYTVRNVSDKPVAVTLVGSLFNPVGGTLYDQFMNVALSKRGRTKNEFRNEPLMRGLYFHATDIASDDLHYGNMSLVTTHRDVTVKPTWLRSSWWDFLQEFWDDLSDDGKLNDLGYDESSPDRQPDSGSLGVRDTIAPGEEQSFRFILSWYFPNRLNSWRSERPLQTMIPDWQSVPMPTTIIRNRYAARFGDSWAVAAYVLTEWKRLESATRNFHDALFCSTLPQYVLDSVSANIVSLRSNTCFWLEDGRFYGWEGCLDDAGSCPGSCTHVWSYAYTPAFLFPSLEREMRRIDFNVETEADGFMNFRNFKSMGEEHLWLWRGRKPEAAADGQLGSILRAYREWRLSGDKAWLQSLWGNIKRALDYASTHWDADGDGVLEGMQHNTYDIEFYGANPLTGIYYLAALRAAEEMAKALGDMSTAEHAHKAYERGSEKLDEMLWSGEFFIQKLDDVDAHKYQHGIGCLSDQLLGQTHAHALGLGDLLPKEHIRAAIKHVYDYNYRDTLRAHANCQRTFALNGEAGLLLCTWPNGGRPKFPFPYSDEVWTGIEYQVAAELIYSGWTAEGLNLVKSIYDRHDGIRRNRWDEVECGHHYARAMSSWAVLLALSGAQADVPKGTLTFDPVLEASTDPNLFQCFWSSGTAWGRYTQRRDSSEGVWTPEIEVLGGSLNGVTITACGKTWRYGG